jgi:large subunit ribosomal protein L25
MSSVVTIEAQARTVRGTGGARALRREGRVPGIVYGQNQENQPISIDPRSIAKELYIPGFFSRLFAISINGKAQHVLIKDVQLHPVNDAPLHIDFMRVSKDSKIHVNIPVRVINDDKAPGVKQGGIVNVVHHTLEVICPADSIPSEILIDLTGMEAGQAIHLTDITLPAGVVAAHPDRDNTLISIVAPGGAEPTAEAEASSSE